MEIQYPFNPAQSVAFSGFRHEKLIASAPGYVLSEIERILFERLQVAIRNFHKEGYTAYITGMADGFDLLAADAVLSLRKELDDLRLACIVPFPTQGNSGSAEYKARYQRIKLSADFYFAVGTASYKSSFLLRNDVLLAQSSALICYYDGVQNGGTKYTIDKATKLKRKILNLYLGRSGKQYNRDIDDTLLHDLRSVKI